MDYLNPEVASNYDNQHEQFRNFEKEAMDVRVKLNITSEDTVLDFGCGTGGIALKLARYSKKVIGVDISQPMLDVLEKNAKNEGIENIETHCAGFLTYQHEGGPVDKMVSKVALHHLPDFWKSVALLNMASILKKGGKLYLFDVIFTFPAPDHEHSLENLVETMKKHGGDSLANETLIHIKDEYSTYDWIMEGLLKKTGFVIISKTVEAENYVTYICSKL
ncbi:class I SAM-dependent methyltransferase [Methanobacterium sp. CWC-01]|uniref:class I SAM-dependent methyltransferase n=1 Tax=Methanobacterium aridiramus TaxID=2584467 RepID=UPI0025753E74|nr:class I SAM-dependent methyltransferase [Methanobacterium sp. CWC-01]WJI08787.1 class I SAM-dependent methyltransferase [Methanobacterium sp. CWC-01]